MKDTIASYRIDNADDLLQTLLRYNRSEREAMAVEDYDCLDVVEETLTDGSKVLNLKGRWFTEEQKRRERGGA